jgi:UDP:flavonoid glycosyltransferase YjiC (YdhE family)
MRITVLAVGSRGEVEPLVALAAGLQLAGHQIRFATHQEFKALVTGQRLNFAPLWGSVSEALATPAGQRLLHSGGNPFRALGALCELIPPAARRLYDDSWSASQDAEAIIYGQIAVVGPHIAEKLRVPALAAFVDPICPGRPTAAFPRPGMPELPLGGWYNRLTHVALVSGMTLVWQATLNRWRQMRLGQRPVRHGKIVVNPDGIVYSFSPTLLPKPREWGKHVLVSGYWFLEPSADWQPSPDLVTFIKEGSPPVYVGFGSMMDNDPSLTKTILHALKQADRRGILLVPSLKVGADRVSGSVLAVDAVPFRWLFPRLAAVVHHGGLGTTHSALRDGVPQVVIPFMGDQSFWARRTVDIGVSPVAIPRRRLSAEKLAAAIEAAIGCPRIGTAAMEVSIQLSLEPGVAGAVRFIERRLSQNKHHSTACAGPG